MTIMETPSNAHDVALGASSYAMEKMKKLAKADGFYVSVEIFRIKRNAEANKSSLHELVAHVGSKHLEPMA